MQKMRDTLSSLTARNRQHVDLGDLIAELNAKVTGWRNYFRIGNSTKKLADLDRFLFNRLWIFLSRRRGNHGRLLPEAFMCWLSRSGLASFYPQGRGWISTLHASR